MNGNTRTTYTDPFEAFSSGVRGHGGRLIGVWDAESCLCAYALPSGEAGARRTAPIGERFSDALEAFGSALCEGAGSKSMPFFRAVSLERLPSVWNTGCDKEPTSAAMHVSQYADKVLEYGGWPKAIQIFDGAHLRQSWREAPASTPAAELAAIQKDLPTKLVSDDGQSFWFTRFPRIDNDRTHYEAEWGHWIPGDAFKALLAVVVLVTDETEFLAKVAGLPGISLELSGGADR